MSFLETIEPQDSFPYQDLTPENAEHLKLIMSNASLVKTGHAKAEKVYPIFTGTHAPLVHAVRNLYEQTRLVQAVNFGIVALEAMQLFVSAQQRDSDFEILEQNVTGIVAARNIDGVEAYFSRAHAEFLAQTPRTAEVIATGASRFFSEYISNAVLGGAIARQFEIHNTK